jgi:polar amino acid transport system permease protein
MSIGPPDEDPGPSGAVPVRAVPVRHPGRWASAAVLVVLGAMLVHTLGFSTVLRGGKRVPRFEWGVVGQYLTTGPVLRGLLVTLELSVLAMVVGIILGVLLAVMRLSPNPLMAGTSWLYLWFFRGTPVLVQLLFWYNLSYLYPTFTVGVPFGPGFVHFSANSITPFLAAALGLSLNEGAYMAEIVRAGILSVDEGQAEAASSLGMTRGATLRRIVLPQAMRVIIPPTGNETISMLKTSSLASVITVGELLLAVQNVYSRTYQTIPLLMVASLWYLAVTSVFTVGQTFLERYFGRGSTREPPPGFWTRLRRNLAIRPRNPTVAGAGPTGS